MKNSTKSKIVRRAIELFNIDGFSNVSLIRIAESLSLSPGNLTYHFQKKEDLMHAVYKFFQNELLMVLPEMPKDTSLDNFKNQVKVFYQFQLRFSFFYSDLLEVVRAFPQIGKLHQTHIETQIDRIHYVMMSNVSSGMLSNDLTPSEYRLLAHHIWMTSAFWMSQTKIRQCDDIADDLQKSVWSLIKPHLTKKYIDSTELSHHPEHINN